MRMISVLLISVTLLSVTFATENTIFAQISQESKFGAAISSLVQMHNQAPGGLAEIDSLLKSLKATVEQQQVDEKQRIDEKGVQCEYDINSYSQQIDNSRSQLADQTQEQVELQQELAQKEAQNYEDGNQISQENDDKSEYQSQLNEAEATHLINKANFDEAIAACEEAVNLLNQIIRSKSSSFIQNGVMFVQLSQRFEKIKNVLEKGTQKTHNAFIEPIINILMELGASSSLDLEAVQQIIGLIQTLQNRLREGLIDHETQYGQTVSGLNTLISDIEAQIYSHQNQLKLNEERIQYIQERLEQLSGLIQITDELVTQVSNLKSALEASCAFEYQAYSEAEQNRQTQLLTLEKLITYFEGEVVTKTENIY